MATLTAHNSNLWTFEISDDVDTPSYKAVGCPQSVQLQTTSETIDVTCLNAGKYKSKINGQIDWNIQVNGFVLFDSAEYTFTDLAAKQEAQTTLLFRFTGPDTGDPIITGEASVTGLNMSFAVNSAVGYDFTLESFSALTYDVVV